MVSPGEARCAVCRWRGFPNSLIGRSAGRASEPLGRARCNPIAESLPLRGTRLPVSAGTVPDFPSLASLAPARARIRGINLTEA
jgi:hypothetical protein